MRREEKIVDQKSLSISDLQIYYLDLDNSVKIMREKILLDGGAVTVEVQNQPINSLNNIESKRSIINHCLIHANIIISVMNITVGNQISASYVYQRIISDRIQG